MNNTKHNLLITLYAILVKGKVHYATPRPITLLELLKNFHHIDIHYRWLFQCLTDLEEAGYITRQKRWDPKSLPTIHRLPALLAITIKGTKYLTSGMVEGSRKLYHQMLSWLNRKDHRFPKPQDIYGLQCITSRGGDLKKLGEILPPLTSLSPNRGG